MVLTESTVLAAVPLQEPIVHGELCVTEDVSLRLPSLVLPPISSLMSPAYLFCSVCS